MNSVDLKYCGILSTRLDRYKVKSTNPYKANCRCPICGDSKKSKSLSRGWFVEKTDSVMYHCFNCGVSHPLWRYLKVTDPALYNEYVIDSKFDRIGSSNTVPKPLDTITMPVPSFKKSGSPLLKIKKISQLDPNHPARRYADKRLIPVNTHHRIYYAPKFSSWVNELIPGKLPEFDDNPRLVLPMLNREKDLIGFQGRAFDKNSIRYITIMLDASQPKLFGLDVVDFNKKYYVLEGPIDSLFLSNAIAMAGADGNLRGLQNSTNAVFVFDNEPRNTEIVRRMETLIENGHSVCIWPKTIKEKDINDMVISGTNSASIELLIDKNTYSGLAAKLAILEWKKC